MVKTVNTPTGWNDKLNSIIGQWNELSKKEQSELLVMLQKEHLIWNTDAILDDLKKNHVKIEENVEMMWLKWKKVHIDLPAVWNFEWFKFDYFVSDVRVEKKYFEKKKLFGRKSLENKSYSMKDVSKLLQAMNNYMSELQWENDGDIDYEHELIYWRKNKKKWCKAWYCLSEITWLDCRSWLSDKDVDWEKDSRAFWRCEYHDYCFDRCDNDCVNLEANVLLRLSD